jgi:hypothetical protein
MASNPRRIPALAWCIAGTLVLAHLLTLGRYGVFRDEFYYIANGRHLAWGYVDHPPLVAALAWLIEHTIGTSVYALRLPMLLALVGVLAVLAALVRRLGGGGPAIAVAWLAFALGPYYLFAFHYLSMNAPEVLWWSLAALLLMHATDLHVSTEGQQSPAGAGRWLIFGAVMGLAALTKVSGLVWGAALAVAVLVSPARRDLLRPWPWAAVLVAALMFAPHVLWQVQHGWPTAEFVRNAQAGKIVAFAPAGFLVEQLKLLGPVGAIVALIGLGGSLTGRVTGGSVWAVTFLVTLLVFLVQRSKPYYMMPAYPVLLVAGAVLIERWRPWTRAGGRVALLALVALGTALVPLTLPVLPPDRVQPYMRAIGVEVESGERHEKGALPQHFADMFGWETLADDVAAVVRKLPPDERAGARIFAQNYGEAGALEYYGPSRGLPPVISGHNAYWHWGPGPDNGGVVIIVGGRPADHREVFHEVTERGRTTCTFCMPYEQDLPIFVARGWKRPVGDVWPQTKHFE